MLDQRVERTHGFFDRRGGIETMDLIKIDMVELHALQARLDAVHDVEPRGAARIHAVAGLPEHLGGDDHAVARHLQVLERLPRHLFSDAVGVYIGRVDEVDPGVERAPDQALGIGLLQIADMLPDAVVAAEGHRAQAQLRYKQARPAQLVVTHVIDSNTMEMEC